MTWERVTIMWLELSAQAKYICNGRMITILIFGHLATVIHWLYNISKERTEHTNDSSCKSSSMS